jgi:hypothetical protein
MCAGARVRKGARACARKGSHACAHSNAASAMVTSEGPIADFCKEPSREHAFTLERRPNGTATTLRASKSS